ncbi:MAG: YibE/F family protein [Patescibacteria group bacterium]|nr:YibE/F family protein [Patescibacteria group bacterium]
MKKIIILCLFALLAVSNQASAQEAPKDEIFKAKVIEIIAEADKPSAGKEIIKQQHLKLIGLSGNYKDQEFEFNGIGEIDALGQPSYKIGDKVLAAASVSADNSEIHYYIVDYVRTGKLWALAIFFLAAIIAVGRVKGLRALIALGITFGIIIKYIIPQILSGASPLPATLLGSILILIAIIYITEGWRQKSHIAIISIAASLFITVLIAQLFVSLTRLTGAASEEILFLFNIEGAVINLKGLLLAGIIIGALGVLDDVVVSQVAAAEEIASANKNLSRGEIFKKTYKIGVSHISSMANTLFLAYAGVSLPLLILFISGQSAFASWTEILNTELIAVEIVRALAGSIGLILSMPIATFIAAWRFAPRRSKQARLANNQ